jgi:hypothetical protein
MGFIHSHGQIIANGKKEHHSKKSRKLPSNPQIAEIPQFSDIS